MATSDTVLICGSYGTKNLGDTKILEGLTKLSHQQYPDCKVIAASIDPADTADRTSVDEAIPTIERDPLNWMSEVHNVDKIIIGGGTLVNHPHFSRRHAVIISIASILDIDVFVSAGADNTQGVIRRVSKHYLKLVNAITVRDRRSRDIIQSLGISAPIDIVPDPGFVSIGTSNIGSFNLPDNYILISLCRKRKEPSVDISGIAAGLDDINREVDQEIIFFPFHPIEGEDIRISRQVIDNMETNARVISDKYTLREAETIIGRADAVVGMRLHSLILSAHKRTPFTALSYNPKCEVFLEQIGVEDCLKCSDVSRRELYKSVEDSLQNRAPIPDAEAYIQELEHECNSILDQCESQNRQPSYLSLLSICIYLPILLVTHVLNN